MLADFIYSRDGHIYKVLKKFDEYFLLERVGKNLGYIICYKYNKSKYDWENFLEYDFLDEAEAEFLNLLELE